MSYAYKIMRTTLSLMASSKFLYPTVLISTLICGCSLLNEPEKINLPIFNPQKIKKEVTIQKQLSISCNKEDINDYLSKGWKIVKSEEVEVTCSWKAKRSKPGCDMNNDKGCKITVPNKIGKLINYTLEKKSTAKE